MMIADYDKMKNLFLRQSYLDSWEDYRRSLRKASFITWDWVVLTASNENQAEVFRLEIAFRQEQGFLPLSTKFVVLSDPDGKRVGSGGATFNVLRYIAEGSDIENLPAGEAMEYNHFAGKRILVIHSGGDSKRVPQYSACGKLFSPVPRELPDGRPSTLFDEFMIAMAGIPARIPEGMLILSGDVLLLFNPLQIDATYRGAAAISIKEHVSTGKDHGVFLNDGNDNVARFLHKQSEERLERLGAVNNKGYVDLDTGAVLLDRHLLKDLFSLISTDGRVDENKFKEYVNDRARISFYGDFLYPLAVDAVLEEYLQEAAEGDMCQELIECRKQIWKVLHPYQMKLICLSPAEFIHFGTTKELLELVTNEVDIYEFLDWKSRVSTNLPEGEGPLAATHNALIDKGARIGTGCYIEDCFIGSKVTMLDNTITSGISLTEEITVPGNAVLHGLRLLDGRYVVRIYGIEDNPKGKVLTEGEKVIKSSHVPFLNHTLEGFILETGIEKKELWEDEETYLWFAKLYPVCDTMEEAVRAAIVLEKIVRQKASKEEIESWRRADRASLYSSFNEADVQAILPQRKALQDDIVVEKFIEACREKKNYKDALQIFGERGVEKIHCRLILKRDFSEEDTEGFMLKLRVLYALSRGMKQKHMVIHTPTGKINYDTVEKQCFDAIKDAIYREGTGHITQSSFRIQEEEVRIELPVRVNWGGGWTDTPPYCIENGGVVLNAAISLKGILPVQVVVRKIKELHVEFASEDIGVTGVADTVAAIQDCHNPYDNFALHKAALIACGIIPVEGEYDLQEILEDLGGGIYLSTQVIGVPKGSGLGTSSILSGACVKGLFQFLGKEASEEELYSIVLCMEQIMSTGGGWQDQVGGLTEGIKYITSKPGIHQTLQVEKVTVPAEALAELQDRFALIYTGQRRLARNLLRDVVGGVIGGREESVSALYDMQRIAALMRFELERGNIDEFAFLLNNHWELSKQLDAGSTNTCIDQIFMACEDMIDAKFISGAGGGGFLQVILKKGVTKEALRERLHAVFQESGVDVWECAFV